ncbi:MAG: SRPBCC family protein [Chloroflexi bacterium]|nr:SRPBCC family protein [Chloroflexota bacterium]
MSDMKSLAMQVHIEASQDAVFRAITTTDAVRAWLAESADIDLAAGRFLFWGQATPYNPSRHDEVMALLAHEAGRLLKFAWKLGQTAGEVTIRLRELGAGRTALTLIHQREEGQEAETFTLEDFWFVHLENLRRYIDGKSCEARVDFSRPMTGDIKHSLAYSASPETIFSVLTRPSLMERWIANQARVELKPGGEYDLGWGIEGIRVVDYEVDKRLTISWQMADGTPTRATWRLERSADKTRIHFDHSGFSPDFPNNGIWIGWLNYLNWVRSVAEYGETWQPPAIPLAEHPWAHIYPKSMHEMQEKLVQSDLQVDA